MKSTEKIFKQLNCGDISIKPFYVTDKEELVYPKYCLSENCADGRFALIAAEDEKYRDSLYFICKGDEVYCSRSFENMSNKVMKVKELGCEISGIDFGKDKAKDYYYHNENPRVYMQMTFTIDRHPDKSDAKSSDFDEQAGNKWFDEGVVHGRTGASPYQPFPAILFSNYDTNIGLVHGTLSQKIFYHNYSFSHNNGAIAANVYSSFKTISHMDVKPGRVLTDEWYMGRTENADDIEKLFEKYANALRKKLPVNYGSTDINRNNMVWGTWNDGVFRDVSEDFVLREAKYLKDNFPTVDWIQLDDGYAVFDECAHGLGVPYEGEEGIDYTKFPHGLRALTDEIRKIGLRPAIWIGGFCPTKSKIYVEHPEWFFDYNYRVDIWKVLDVSVDETRAYMENAVNVLCRKYGFDAVKHDFWSYAFEDSHPFLKNKEKSGYEYRDWWLKEIRGAIPADGYFQTGCDIVMGNPFLGEYFTNYRYGIDIGGGDWENVRTNFLWGTACFALHTGDLFVPNSDAVGMLPGLNDDEAYFCINYCLVTHSMVEIAGKLSKAPHNGRYKMLKKAVCNPNNGQDIYFVNYDYRNPAHFVPEIIYFNTPHFSKIEKSCVLPVKTVGLFNVSEEEKTLSFNVCDLGLEHKKYIITDVWSGEQFEFDSKAEFSVRPHASRLLAVSCADGLQLFDANIRVNSACRTENSLVIESGYAAENVEMTVSEGLKKIYINGEETAYTADGNTVSFDAKSKGKIELVF